MLFTEVLVMTGSSAAQSNKENNFPHMTCLENAEKTPLNFVACTYTDISCQF